MKRNKRILHTVLWAKFWLVVIMFLVSVSLNFLIASTIDPGTSFYLLLLGKPALVLAFLLCLNLVFHFPKKIPVPNVIPSTFLVLSILVFFDLGYLIWKYFAILSPHLSFWGIYGGLLLLCGWNLHKYVRAFTTGVNV